MSGALKAGSVYVAVSASLGEFTKQLAGVVKSVEQTAARVKAAAAPLADVGKLFAAGMGGAVLAASKSNAAIRADLDKLTKQFYTLAADIGDAFGPFLKQLIHAVGSLVGAFQRLSPETKASLAHFVIFMAAMGAGASVLLKGATLVEGVAKVASTALVPALGAASTAAKLLGEAGGAAFPALGKAVAGMEGGVLQSIAKMAAGFVSVLIPIAAVVAAIVGVALLAGAVYEAWNGGGNALAQTFKELWASVKELGSSLLTALSGWWDSFRSFILKGVGVLLEAVAGVVRGVAVQFEPLLRGLGMTKLADTFKDLESLTGDKLLKDLQSGAAFLADKALNAASALADGAVSVGKDMAEGVAYGLSTAVKGVKHIAADTGLDKLPERLKAALSGLLGGPQGRTRDSKALELERDPSKVGTSSIADMMGAGSIRDYAKGVDAITRAHEDMLADKVQAYVDSVSDELKAAAEKVEEQKRKRDEVWRALGDKALGSLGDLGTTIQNAAKAAQGGPWAVIASVLLDLLTKSKGFAALMNVIQGIFQTLSDAFGELLPPLEPLFGAVGMIVSIIGKSIGPVLRQLGQVFQNLAPIIVLAAHVIEALQPITLMFIEPILKFIATLVKVLFPVFKFIALVILNVSKGLANAWNALVSGVQGILRGIGKLPFLGKAKALADSMNGLRINTEGLTQQIQNIKDMTFDAAMGEATDAASAFGDAAADAAEALSNVPNAFKIALRRFQSQDAQNTFNGPGVPIPTRMPGLPAGAPVYSGNGGNYSNIAGAYAAQSAGPTFNISTTITTTNPTEAMAKYEQTVDKVAYRLTGSRGRAGRWAVPEGT